ncbi:MAG TPA: flagellar hook basal-body protein [Acetobacteraceae bacterium]|nr:flagellar hook basal-body protein [Acetobacteraceae bacterium]
MASSLLFTAMAGLEVESGKLDTIAENVSNTDTIGYAAAQTAALALPYAGENSPSGADVTPLDEGTDIAEGPIQRTGSPLDLAVKGGWLVVQAPDGGVALTRNGILLQGADGALVTQDGDPVLDANEQPINLPPLKDLQISQDGTISGIPTSSDVQQASVYGTLFIAATPQNARLVPLGGTLYGLQDNAQPTQATNAQVMQGYLEGSNVDPVQSMVDMISGTRSFQLLSQIVSGSGNAEQSLNQVLTAAS